jgi:hypothetical protein
MRSLDLMRPEILFPVVATLFVLLLLVALRLSSGKGAERRWMDLARLLGARLFVQGGDHRLRIPWRGVEAALDTAKGLRFEIGAPPGSFPSLGASYGAAPRGEVRPARTSVAPAEDEAREEGFVVETADADGAELFQGAGARILEDLKALAPYGWMKITMGPSLRIESNVNPSENETVLRFARLCLRLAETARAFASRSGQVTITSHVDGAEGDCQVCGARLEAGIVRCSACRTPHHEDCWTWVGACSTYACKERSFVRG